MRLNKSILARAGKVRIQTPKSKLYRLSKKVKRLQGRARKRQQFGKFMNFPFLHKIKQQNKQSIITRKGWQRRTIETQMIKNFIKELK